MTYNGCKLHLTQSKEKIEKMKETFNINKCRHGVQ